MTKKWQYLCRCLLVLVFIGGVIPAKAQLVERVCRTDYKISPERKGELLLELDNISFFKDNEFAGTVDKRLFIAGTLDTTQICILSFEEYQVGRRSPYVMV